MKNEKMQNENKESVNGVSSRKLAVLKRSIFWKIISCEKYNCFEKVAALKKIEALKK